MANLKSSYGPISLKNPIMLSAADHTHNAEQIRQAIDAGAAAVVPKTLTNDPTFMGESVVTRYRVLDPNFRPVNGRPPRGFSLISRGGGMKTDEDNWIEQIGELVEYAKPKDAKIIASIWGSIPWMIERAQQLEAVGVAGIEIDVGCPHLDGNKENNGEKNIGSVTERTRGLEAVVQAVKIPVFYKVASRSAADIKNLIPQIKAMGFAGATMHNRYLGFIPDIETGKPIMDAYGGIGGSWTLPLTLYSVYQARMADPTFPMCGTNGACSAEDVLRFLMTGTSAVEICSIVLTTGYDIITKVIRDLEQYLDRRGIENISELVGVAADSALSRPQIKAIKECASIDEDKCIRCGTCVKRCPWGALSFKDGKVKVLKRDLDQYSNYHISGCLGCGLCTTLCPKEAISLINR